jgi:hypothetical protein
MHILGQGLLFKYRQIIFAGSKLIFLVVHAHGVIFPRQSIELGVFCYLFCILLYKSASSFKLKITNTFDLAVSYLSPSPVFTTV